MRVIVQLMLVGVLASVFAVPVQAQTVKIALWRLKPLGLDAATADKLEVLLRAETSRMEGFSLQTGKRTEAILARPRNAKLRKCGGETVCLCGIGKALGVGKLVTGVIGGLGDDYTFDLKLVDIRTCREERRINEALSGREDLLIGAIRRALYKLVTPELFVGSIGIDVPVEGARVIIDDRQVGVTPLAAPVGGLKPGSHKLQIVMAGLSAFEDSIPVRFQVVTRVKVDLVRSTLLGLSYEKEKPEEVTPQPDIAKPLRKAGSPVIRVLAWGSLGLSAAAIVGASLAGWRSNVLENEVAAAAANNRLISGHQDTINRGETYAMLSNLGWGVAGGAAVLSVVLFLADSFSDGGGSSATVAPTVTKAGGGMVLLWSF
jgi:phage shock protein PspC (stress-responsive transcriptional regulator)